ncbi:MAG: SusC/RagA family TonB-linked outer membrane protein, partial [Flavobacteriaceae bacterium]|nr:SusC/RagA family TonB-linked outer membrane protein [Flavobacteriaceae bacterium]
TNTLLGNSTLSYAILSNLNISANLGYSNIDINEESIEPNTQYNPAWGLTSDFSYLLTNSGNRHSWIVEPQINWDFNLGKGKINMLVGSSFQEQFSDKISFLGFGFSNNSLIHNLSAASNIYIANESKNQYRYQSLYGRVNYSLKDKYIVNLTGRRDGSSRFGPGKKYANFGAIGIAYLFSREEGFNKIFPFISFGKLRASYGTTGNDQIGDYQYLDTYTISGSIYNGTVGLVPSRLLNPDFAWEINRKLETSLELGLWNNCINLTTTYYQNRSSNQLVGIPLPGTTGFQSIQANLDATVLNSGWEFDFNSRNINGKYLKWTTSLNLTLPKNKLEKFPGLEGSTYANTYVIGKPLTIKKLYHFTGVNPDTGLFEFEDYNGDGIISAPEDMQYTEDLSPTLFGGISNTINYKNWKFVVFFQFTKHNLFNNFYSGTPAGMMVNQPAVISARWRNPGDIAPYQRVTSGNDGLAVDAFYKFKDSNGAISDASYIRLKNISIAYTFPETIFGNTGCTLYLEGQNLLTFTKFKSGDPEQVTASTYLPQLRRMSFRVQFNF